MSDIITLNHDQDGIDRRGFLKGMASADPEGLWFMTGGIVVERTIAGRAAGDPFS
jgi:hypothetical protein